jgi:hypothetical protein
MNFLEKIAEDAYWNAMEKIAALGSNTARAAYGAVTGATKSARSEAASLIAKSYNKTGISDGFSKYNSYTMKRIGGTANPSLMGKIQQNNALGKPISNMAIQTRHDRLNSISSKLKK